MQFRSKENIKPIVLANKEVYYNDLVNIEHSWSGRIDAINVCNTFIMESVQLLVNAMEVFELGYFDCAYYSLRSAIEIYTTMIFLVDISEDRKAELLEKWKKTKNFPMYGQMLNELSQKGNVYQDIKSKIPKFFERTKILSNEINKYVHKQGFRHLYVSKNHPINVNKSQEDFSNTFIYYLEQCIGVVAVMRLVLDPFPILLMDEEILYRCFDCITEPYSNHFVEKYIDEEIILAYKTTALFQQGYASFINDEKKNKSVYDVVKYQYIDTSKIDELISQFHLMSLDDIISVLMVSACEKAVNVYAIGGLPKYFTDRNTLRKSMSWSGLIFKEFETAENKTNQIFDEVYISTFKFNDTYYHIEHNDKLVDLDIENIQNTVNVVLDKIPKLI